ncbi:phage tail protein I [Kribbella sp. NPDC056861]|uniref:phage tail protein I n=1 Tax=Kribbella sp. NPDC056861 TaxID=3154857 RepID=UPI0034242B8D
MRGTPGGLGTPYPLGSLLPGVFQEDEFLIRFTAAIDELIAPAIATLDCLAAYVDPALAPPDYLGWLAGWVGTELDETWSVEQQRAAIAQAVELHRGRGTIGGLSRQLELATGGEVEVTDTGGVRWSLEPVDDHTGHPPARLTVVIRGTDVSAAAVDDLVNAAKPAHVPHEVRVEPLNTPA